MIGIKEGRRVSLSSGNPPGDDAADDIKVILRFARIHSRLLSSSGSDIF
jgi:hypothetical protein